MVPTWMNTEFDDKKRCECIFLILGHLPNLVNFIFDRNYPKLSMRSEQIRNEITSFSTGEQILIRIALDFWDGSGETPYLSVINELSEDNFKKVIQATTTMRKI